MSRPAASRFRCESAWLPDHPDAIGGVARDVAVTVVAGRVVAVEPGAASAGSEVRLAGFVVPGLANSHSHAFHRALRTRTQADSGTFWTWRDQMYAVAGRLDPDSYERLATAAFAEMALAGVTCVGEFHYLHHAPDGSGYDDPNAMGLAVVRAARAAGLRVTLLDACYLAGGVGLPLREEQRRFGDGDALGWASRADALVAALDGVDGVRVGAAVHSVRAVPPEAVATVAAWADRHAAPLHAHLSEQTAENAACVAAFDRTPARVLYDAGALGPHATVVHATHLTPEDTALLGATRTTVCLCPTTERDLADGIGPAGRLSAAGSPLSLGSDSHAVVDLLEEARGVEMHERLADMTRGHFSADALLTAATSAGHACLGWPDAGRIAVGQRADLVALRTGSVRTAGALPGAALAVFAATAADVDTVVVDGDVVVSEGRHARLGDVGAQLAAAVAEVSA